MKEAKLNKEHLDKFLSDLRTEDKLEVEVMNCADFSDELFKASKDKNGFFYFLLTNDNKPLALGGAKQLKNPKIAKVWMLCTNELNSNKIEFYKYVQNKIEFLKIKFDVLYNFIYKSNFSSLNWLKKCGFSELSLKCMDYKLFYFIKGGVEFDLRYFTSE